MSTFNYSFDKLYGPGTTCSIDLVAGTTYTFDITNNSGSSHFTLETVRNYDGVTPKNLSGSFTNFSNIAESVISDYIAGFVLPTSINSFDFTPANNVVKETLMFRGTGGIILGTGSAPSPPTPPSTASFRIDTTQTTAGSTSNNQFKLPLISTTAINFTIDWGDNTSDNITIWNQPQVTHTYAATGSYDITITSGLLKGWQFGGSGDRNKLMEVYDWSVWEFDTFGAFRGCNNLVSSATSAPTAITTTSLITMFQRASNFNGPLNGWDVSGVEEFRQMFSEASSFNQPLNGWDMSNAINTNGMFTSASSFNQPLDNWDVSKVAEMQNMFSSASAFNQDIGNWNVSSSLNMAEMFNGATAFNQNIGSWDVRNVGSFINFMASKTPSTFSTANLDAIYSGWSQLTGLEPSLSISFGTAKYTDVGGLAGRNILTGAPNNWTIVDGGS